MFGINQIYSISIKYIQYQSNVFNINQNILNVNQMYSNIFNDNQIYFLRYFKIY